MDSVLLVYQRASAGGANLTLFGFVEVNTLGMARLVRHVEDGRDGLGIAMDGERLFCRLAGSIGIKFDLPLHVIFRHQ